jgi:sugar transferase (PEP-CTERM/EpsH1 system associated)
MEQTLIRRDECSAELRETIPGKQKLQVRRLRILHVIPQLMPGGTEYTLLRLIRALDSAEFEHEICATRAIDPEFAKSQMVSPKAFCVGKPGARYQFPFFRLAHMMRSIRPDVVHSRNWGGIEAIAAARFAGVPVVVHSEHGYELDSLGGLPYRRRIFRKAAFAMADAVFTNSRELREYHARETWTSSERLRVIYNGVDTNRFRPDLSVRDRVREELSIAPDCLLLGSVGRLVAIKDHRTLLNAASLLAGQGVKVKLLLAGAGPESTALQRQAAEDVNLRDRVIFTGASDRISELLNAMDIFVLPSLGEGMSNTLLEAMASGLPVVASRVGGNPELIQDEEAGFLFNAGDSANLVELLKRFCEPALRQRLGNACRTTAIQRFSVDRMVEEYRSLYRGLAGQKQLH